MIKGIGYLALGLALMLSGGSAKATYVVYADRASFQAAVASQQNETFNELGPQVQFFSNGLSQSNGLALPISVTGYQSYLLSASSTSLSGFYPSNGTYLLGGIGNSPNQGITVTLPTNTYTAAGADVTTYAANSFITISGTTSTGEVFSGTVSTSGANPNAPLAFLGIATTTPGEYINSIVFSTTPGQNVNGIIDNVSIGQAIPEPASMALFATGGLIAVASLIRRRFRTASV